MNAIPSAVARADVADDDRRAVDQHLAGVGLLDPADDLHQRGLAGAVLAEQRDDFARVHVEVRRRERMDAGEPLLIARSWRSGARGHRPRSCAQRRPELVDVVLANHPASG